MIKSPCKNCGGMIYEELFPDCAKVCFKIKELHKEMDGEVSFIGTMYQNIEITDFYL